MNFFSFTADSAKNEKRKKSFCYLLYVETFLDVLFEIFRLSGVLLCLRKSLLGSS